MNAGILDKPKVLLQVALVLYNPGQPAGIAREQIILMFDPCKQRGVIRMLNSQRKAQAVMHAPIEVIETLDAWKSVWGIFAEMDHEARIPNPYRRV